MYYKIKMINEYGNDIMKRKEGDKYGNLFKSNKSKFL